MKQDVALDILQEGKNVFLTGQAGSGKTYLINQYIDWLRRHQIEPTITASTGIAATHVGGTTIHSYSGMGIASRLTPELQDEILARESVWKRLSRTKVLIIDEISMVSASLLDALDQLMRVVHNTPEVAFGGIQIVMSGDFFQLPPIIKNQQDAPGGKRYAWQSQAWIDACIVPCYLEEQHRQHTSDVLSRILNDIRDGEATEDSLADLRSRFECEIDSEHEPIMLYTHNADVDRINQERLEEISEAPHFFEMQTRGSRSNIEKLKAGCLAPELLELRVGAVVMFVRNNFEKGYVNGSMGKITSFDTKTGLPLVDLYSGGVVLATNEEWTLEEDGKKKAIISQLPLRLAWAITVHKSQGMSLDSAIIDLSKSFEAGQGYVALSRVRSLDGLYLRGFNAQATLMDPLSIRVNTRFQELSHKAQETHEQTPTGRTERTQAWIERLGGSVEEIDYVSEKEQMALSTQEQTKALLAQGLSLDEIAETRALAVGTIVGHILDMKHRGETIDISHIDSPAEHLDHVREAYQELLGQEAEDIYTPDGRLKLKPLYEMLDKEISYDDIKRALLHIM